MKRKHVFLMLIMSLVVVGLSVDVQATGIGFPDYEINDCNCISDDPPAIVVTTSSNNDSFYSTDPDNVVNGSGARKFQLWDLAEPNGCDYFSRDPNDMWLCQAIEGGTIVADGDHWIRFDFDKSYNVEQILIWNYSPFDPNLNLSDPERTGMNGVVIKGSNVENPAEEDWTIISETAIPISNGLWRLGDWALAVDKTLILDGSPLRNVIILANGLFTNPNTNHRSVTEQFNGDNAVGLTEVRFVIPQQPESCIQAIDMGYGLAGDFSEDCYVDLKDMAEAAENWLECMDPLNVGCTHPWE